MKKVLLLIAIAFCFGVKGQSIITTVAGNGTQGYSGDGGQATAAGIYQPYGVVVDTKGNLYVTDPDNFRIRIVNTNGIISTYAGNGTAGYSGDGGQATAAEINAPTQLALDAMGNLYVSDHGINRIRKINTSGIITTVVGNGTQGYSGDGGQATLAEIYNPTFVTVDLEGNLYIAF